MSLQLQVHLHCHVCSTYSNNLSLGNGGSDAPHEQRAGAMERPRPGRVIFGLLFFFLVLFNILLWFLLFIVRRKRGNNSFSYQYWEQWLSVYKKQMLWLKFHTFAFLFLLILVFLCFLLHRFIRAVWIWIGIRVRVTLRGAAFIIAVSTALPLSSWLINENNEGYLDRFCVSLANNLNNESNTYFLGFRHFFFGSFFLCLLFHIFPFSCSRCLLVGRVALLLWHSLLSSARHCEISN